MTHDEIVRLKEDRYHREMLQKQEESKIRWKVFKPCLKGMHGLCCAQVNVFDPTSWCSCECHREAKK